MKKTMVSICVSSGLFAELVNGGIRLVVGKGFEVSYGVSERGSKTNLGKKIRDFNWEKTSGKGMLFAGGILGDLNRKFHLILVDVHVYEQRIGGKVKHYLRLTFAREVIPELKYVETKLSLIEKVLFAAGFRYMQIYDNGSGFFSVNLGGRNEDWRGNLYAVAVTPRKFRIWGGDPFFLKRVPVIDWSKAIPRVYREEDHGRREAS